ncbi:hypothetical protein FDI69_gp009 [Rhodococcus phage Trina]|uniref:Uncharacterized protein n=1 Tax=Rhodococcus phage Trina TaxID=2027905 RepID=A0A2D1ADN6_9CAUD|nr:hypothetical protein FDI69_gp009 [Rhodococcus phage Trina]ASZ74827.1 hypothetical protein SEA_TRINA_9 [Rhodococcus phage Trina]
MPKVKFVWSEPIKLKHLSTAAMNEALESSLPDLAQWAEAQQYPDARKIETGYELLTPGDFATAKANDERKELCKYIEQYIQHEGKLHKYHRLVWTASTSEIYFIIRDYGIHIKRRHEIGFFINANNT